MNKLVATLAATTALFAGTTFYYWQKLEALESAAPSTTEATAARSTANGDLPAASAASTAATPGAGDAPMTLAAGAASAAVPGSDVMAGPASDPGSSREFMLPFARDFLRQYDDPAQRASLVRAARAGLASQYLRLKERLKLDDNLFAQLVDLMAEEQMDQQANYYRCLVNPRCDTANMPQPRDRTSEYQALLGPEGYAKFTGYRSALPEWQSVVQLRGRLPESNSLKDGDAERLLGALSAERERFVTESNQAGAKLRGWGNGAGMLWYAGDGGVEEQLASATQYAERMRQSAASILNAEQLRAFVQIQEEMLASLATYLHSGQNKQG
jgi:hypothetical protein